MDNITIVKLNIINKCTEKDISNHNRNQRNLHCNFFNAAHINFAVFNTVYVSTRSFGSFTEYDLSYKFVPLFSEWALEVYKTNYQTIL